MNQSPKLPLSLLLLLLLSACRAAVLTAPSPSPLPRTATTPPRLSEVPVTLLPLDGPAAQRNAEYSGMAWYGETLVLLPQYPSRFAAFTQGADGALFLIPRQEILDALEASPVKTLTPTPLAVTWGDLRQRVEGFEGFEALTFHGDTACLTIEASPGGHMRGYLVCGTLSPDLQSLHLAPDTLREIPLPADISNKSAEALLWTEQGVAAFYEVNGAQLNPDPEAWLFAAGTDQMLRIPFPRLEYRLTDLTALDAEDTFWGINYFYPGDVEQRTDSDPLAAQYGLGSSHAAGEAVERLVAFHWSPQGISLLAQPPVYLQLAADGQARNWEGLVRLGARGFLLVTDKYPQTLLGFVPH